MKNRAIQFEALENAKTFKRLYFELAWGFQPQLLRANNKFYSQTTKNYYAKTSWNVSNDFEFSNVSEEDVKKNLLSLNTSKATGMDQIPANFQRDGAEALALPLGNMINLSIKLSTFSEECKISKLKSSMYKTGTIFYVCAFQILTTLKKHTRKIYTFFYVTQKTHITPFHTNNNF